MVLHQSGQAADSRVVVSAVSVNDAVAKDTLFVKGWKEDFDCQGTEDYEIRVINNWGADYAVHLNFTVSL